jgi:hypothetical protein
VPIFVGCLALLFPRVALFLVWLLGPVGYLGRAIDPWWWIALGFFFAPLTTLAFAYGVNSLTPAGDMPPLGWVLVAFGALIDLGLLGGGASSRRG